MYTITSIEYESRPTLTLAQSRACSAPFLGRSPISSACPYLCRSLYSHYHQIQLYITNLCRTPLQVSSRLLEVVVALLVGPTSTKTNTDERGPSSSLEQEDGEDDTESEAEGRLDEEV